MRSRAGEQATMAGQRRHSRRQAGLTLMEILVAISLLSLLSVAILMALRIGAQAWERTNASLMLDRRIATANAILNAELEGIFAAEGRIRDPNTQGARRFLFFQGQPESMRFVTSYSLERGPHGGLRVVELQVTPAARGLRVLLNERIYDSPDVAALMVTGLAPNPQGPGVLPVFAPIMAQPSSFIIADELETCSFAYLTERRPNRPAQWIPAWADATYLPAAISIQLTPREDPDGSRSAAPGDAASAPVRLRPVSVTVPVRSTMSSQ